MTKVHGEFAMSAAILPFPSNRRVTGEAIRLAKQYQKTHDELRQGLEADRFIRDWLAAFEEECARDRAFETTLGLI